jgi:hypothetical protein
VYHDVSLAKRFRPSIGTLLSNKTEPRSSRASQSHSQRCVVF